MELWVALVLLYAAQCLVRVPPGWVLFTRPLRRWRFTQRDGWRVAHPLPSALSLFASRLPVEEVDGRLRGRGGVRGLSGGALTSRPLVEVGGDAAVAARGTVVRVGDRPVAQALTHHGAEALADRLRALCDPASDPAAILGAALEVSLRSEQLRERRAEFALATRWLRPATDVYAALLFAVLPAVVAWRGAEAGLLYALPVAGLLHVSTLACYGRAYHRLRPGRRGDLIEALFASGLYPPLLLRSHQELAKELLSGYHPAAVAAVVLEGEPRRAFLRSEIATARNAAASDAARGLGLAAMESEALESLCEAVGEPPESLLAPPARLDPLASSYCPACHEPYRRLGGQCVDCVLPLTAYPDAALEA